MSAESLMRAIEVLMVVFIILFFLIAHLFDRSRQNRKRIAALEAALELQKQTNTNLAKIQVETSQAVEGLMRQAKHQQRPRYEPTRKNNGRGNRDQVRPRQR